MISKIRGQVIPGDQRGRELGFPTANIDILKDQVSLAEEIEGVWAGFVEKDDGFRSPATISIGRRSTFYNENGDLLLEAHLLDFDGDLYGKTLTVHLSRFIRHQFKFLSIDELISCMVSDVLQTRSLLNLE